MKTADIDGLVRLARMVRDADLSALRDAQARREAARAARVALDLARRSAVAAATDPRDPAGRANAETHARLLTSRQGEAALEEAQAAAALAGSLARATRSFGRCEAAAAIASRIRHDLDRARARALAQQDGAGTGGTT